MTYPLAKRFAAAVREVFPEARADSAEEGGKEWRRDGCRYHPETDRRLPAIPDFKARGND